MALKMFNGLQIEVPDGWVDTSTVVVSPAVDAESGQRPPINLVVKRRPCAQDQTEQTVLSYLRFMKKTFGELEDVQTKEMMAGSIKGKAVLFHATSDNRRFRQITFVFHAGSEEVSATVTQIDGDPTPLTDIEKLLRSIRPAAGGMRGLR